MLSPVSRSHLRLLTLRPLRSPPNPQPGADTADPTRELPALRKGGRKDRLRRLRRPRLIVDWDSTNLRDLMDARHPAVVTTFGGVTLGGMQFVVQEHVANGSLFDLLFCNIVPLDIVTVVEVASSIASGCRYLHEARVPLVARLTSKTVLLTPKLAPKILLTGRVKGDTSGMSSLSIWRGDAALAQRGCVDRRLGFSRR